MIPIINDSIFNATEKIICNQVNCKGIMSKGINLEIKIRYPDVYYKYFVYCNKNNHDKKMLGKVLYVPTRHNTIIANIFGQYDHGTKGHTRTNYDALRDGLEEIRSKNVSVAIPYDMGSDEVSGGDIDIIHGIINDVFDGCEDVKIYKCK